LLLLDEPTTGLDPEARDGLWGLVRRRVEEGVTVLLTTHYLEEAEAYADRFVILHHGRVAAAGERGADVAGAFREVAGDGGGRPRDRPDGPVPLGAQSKGAEVVPPGAQSKRAGEVPLGAQSKRAEVVPISAQSKGAGWVCGGKGIDELGGSGAGRGRVAAT
jgi:ABC-type multidrug transport system ATPase subunit